MDRQQTPGREFSENTFQYSNTSPYQSLLGMQVCWRSGNVRKDAGGCGGVGGGVAHCRSVCSCSCFLKCKCLAFMEFLFHQNFQGIFPASLLTLEVITAKLRCFWSYNSTLVCWKVSIFKFCSECAFIFVTWRSNIADITYKMFKNDPGDRWHWTINADCWGKHCRGRRGGRGRRVTMATVQ